MIFAPGADLNSCLERRRGGTPALLILMLTKITLPPRIAYIIKILQRKQILANISRGDFLKEKEGGSTPLL